jgi:hypothetical protein
LNCRNKVNVRQIHRRTRMVGASDGAPKVRKLIARTMRLSACAPIAMVMLSGVTGAVITLMRSWTPS